MKTTTILISAALLSGVAATLIGRPARNTPRALDHNRDETAPLGAGVSARQSGAFVPNLGQWAHDAHFVRQIGATTAFLDDRGFVVRALKRGLRPGSKGGDEATVGAAVRLGFAGARSSAPKGEQALAGRHSYFLGSDPARWRSEVPRYGKVRWTAPWPGVDITLYERDGHLEYDFELAIGADLEQVEVTVEGAENVSIDGDGRLVIATAAGTLHQPPPQSWTVAPTGERTPIDVRYELRGNDRFGLRAPEWGGDETLVVDPGLIWSTYLGGSGSDRINDVHMDAKGLITVVGTTQSSDFPTTLGSLIRTAPGGGWDTFVARIDPSLPAKQQLVAATYLGGNGNDWGNGVHVNSTITVIGSTESANFPMPATVNPFDPTLGGRDAFIVVLDLALSKIRYSTFLGGSAFDHGYFVASDPNTLAISAVVRTRSTNYPVTAGAFDRSYNGGWDHGVTRIDWTKPRAQQLVYSTYVGGSGDDVANSFFMQPSGRMWFCGYTLSRFDYPTKNAFQPSHGGANRDAFLTCVDPSQSANQLHYSSYIGGRGTDECKAVHVDGSGVVTIGGTTNAPDFNSKFKMNSATSFQATYRSCPPRQCENGFIVRLDPSRSGSGQLRYSTFFNGPTGYTAAQVAGLHVDAAGIVTFAGVAWTSPSLPTTYGAYDRTSSAQSDGFLARLDPSLEPRRQLLYSTFIGGSGGDQLTLLAGVRGTTATVAGFASSTDLQVPAGAYDPTHNGGVDDGFIARIDMRPSMVKHGDGCTGSGTTRLSLDANGNPAVPNLNFELSLTGGPRGFSLFALGLRLLQKPLPISPGCTLNVDPTPVLLTFIASPSRTLKLPIPALPALLDVEVVWQGAVLDAANGNVVTSNALVTYLGLYR